MRGRPKNSTIAVMLWVLHGFVLVVAAEQTGLSDATQVADIARQKDVVWLSLTTAIVAIGFSAWLVRQMIIMQEKAVDAINRLREELGRLRVIDNKP